MCIRDRAMRLGVEGMMVSPGYQYDKAPDQEHFLGRDRTVQLFRRIFAAGGARAKRWRFNQSPLFLEFLLGERDYECTPWAMPSFGVFGWQKPCYLLQDGYAESYAELLEATDWSRFGHASGNPKCAHCMVHLSLIHISEPTRLLSISYAVFCLKKKKKKKKK